MIEEAYRVLQPGGIALFSTLGKPGPGNFMSLLNKSVELAGVPKKPNNYFGFNDDEYVKKLLKDSGFAKAFSLYSSAYIPLTTVDEVAEFLGRNHVIEDFRIANPEMHSKILEALREEIARILDRGQLITFDYLAVVAIRDS
jgi:SAM-dependent methyltransferase